MCVRKVEYGWRAGTDGEEVIATFHCHHFLHASLGAEEKVMGG